MDRGQLSAIMKEMGTARSRRDLLRVIGRAAIGGLGASLVARGLGDGSLSADITPAIAEEKPGTGQAYIRPNLHGLDPYGPELQAYADAVKAMQALPSTDPLSWAYQANIHATWFDPPPPEPAPPSPEPPGWTTCEHGSLYFWPWHRMYLYWFEQIIRAMSGFTDFALPYWDYTNPGQRVLPAPFRDPASPLFVAARDVDVNGGTPPGVNVPESVFNICNGLSQTAFPFAAGGLESTPHGSVHIWVAGGRQNPPSFGWMAAFTTAGRDPVFWLHHANIDRLWESWLNLGNLNPADSAWLDNDVNSGNGRPYAFFDVNGDPVTTQRVVHEVVDAATQLGYTYEALADLSGCPGFMIRPPREEAPAGTPAATPEPALEFGSSAPEGGVSVGPAPAEVPVDLARPDDAAAIARAGGATILTLEGIHGHGVPAVLVEVYVNLPAGQEPDFRSPYYVGNLNLFGLLQPDQEHQAMQSMTQQFDIARNVTALEAAGEWTGELQVSLVPYFTGEAAPLETTAATPAAAGATPAERIPDGPWVTVERIVMTSG